MPETPSQAEVVEERVIRVFISSTFGDMRAERDELVKRVFPQLRKRCEERGVTWGEVDLRWGITDEQKAEGKVLPICLAEILRCRPYFIGLLGERYGWVPDEIPRELIEREPWLAEHLRRSVTELEILHGVLRNPEMADQAFFYFRDPSYVDSLPSQQQSEFREAPTAQETARYGPEEAERRARERRAKLRNLKARIRESGLPVREGYADPRELGDLVLQDMTEVIDRLFPGDEEVDPLDRDAADHEAFAQSRARVYIGRQGNFDRLEAHAAGDGPPLVVLGESGSGKSALLTNWALRYRRQHPDEAVLMHFIGATPYSADWAAMLRRILGELKRRFELDEALPETPDDLKAALDAWLARVAPLGRVVLILDGLDQLEDRDSAPDLGWLPSVVPPNVRLLVSTLPGRPLAALQRREWPTLEVATLTLDEREQLILETLAQHSKALGPASVRRIAEADASANPLYLTALLDELRLFGRHEQLDEQIDTYLSAKTAPALFEEILARWEADYERDRPGLVTEAMCLIWAARRGLTEAELRDLLGEEGEPLAQALWAPVFLAAERALARRSGRLTFFHVYLRQAVEKRYLANPEHQRVMHLRLAKYFAERDVDERRVEELPWQLQQAEAWESLKDCLTEILMFMHLSSDSKCELLGYWLAIGDRYDMASAYGQGMKTWEAQLRDASSLVKALGYLGSFFRLAGRFAEAQRYFLRAVEVAEDTLDPEDPVLASSLNNLGGLLQEQGAYDEAEKVLRRAVGLHEAALGPEHLELAPSLNNLALLLTLKGGYAAAESVYQRALAIAERALGPEHPRIAQYVHNLASLYHERGDYETAEPLYRRALALREKALGPEHPDVSQTLNGLAVLLKDRGDYEAAESLYRQALAISEKALGAGHPAVALVLSNLAALLYAKGQYAMSQAIHRQALAVREQALGPDHLDVAESLNNLAVVLETQGEYAEAESLHRRALTIEENALGPEHRRVARSLNNLAGALIHQGKYEAAEKLLRRALAIHERALGPEHRDTAASLINLASVLAEKGEYDAAEPLYRRAVAITEESLGPHHPDVANSLDALATLLQTKGDHDAAEPLHRRALAIREKTLGPEHPHVAGSLSGLALVLKTKGDYDAAEPLYRRALAMHEKAFGPDSRDVAQTLYNLAALLEAIGNYDEAESLHRRALAIREKALGPEHPEVASSLNAVAYVLEDKGRYEEAESFYRRALALRERVLGPEHVDVAESLNKLAFLIQNIGDPREAEALHRRALAIFEKRLGPEHPNVAASLNDLGMLLKARGDYEEAGACYERSLAINTKAYGEEHPDVAQCFNNLALLLWETGDREGAVSLTQRALAIREKVLGPEHPDTALSLTNLAGLLTASGRYAEAEPILARAVRVREKVLGENHPATVRIRESLRQLRQALGY